MEESQYLIDTNALIDYLSKKLPSSGMDFLDNIIDAVPNVSVISKIELLGFNAPDEHYRMLTELMNDAIIFHLTENVIEKSIEIRKRNKTKLPDAIIAATGFAYEFTLITRNLSDFENIDGLKLINPHDI